MFKLVYFLVTQSFKLQFVQTHVYIRPAGFFDVLLIEMAVLLKILPSCR